MSGKTKEEIAFELVSKLKGVGVWGEQNMSAILDMYAECLEATSGQRQLPGRSKPVAKAQPAQAQAPAQPPVPPQPVLQVQQGQVAPPQQPAVRQQQQMVQQAYQQQAPQGR